MRTVRNVALYPRLSSADLKGGKLIDESRSITNQKAIMSDYCLKRGWNIHEVYDKDDGVSGTTFQRDDFLRMMSDVEQGLIDCIIIIDLSRFGRNYSEAGLYRSRLQERGVRLIAINDNYDSINDLNQAMNIEVPIKEIFNEYYPAQVSQKVRAVKRMMGEQGHFCNSRAPYGYQKSPENKHILIIDEKIKYNVMRIYELYLGGTSARGIAGILTTEGITPPNQYYYDTVGKINPYTNHNNAWTAATIMGIIGNPVYYGAMCNGKRAVRSYKNKTVDSKPVEDWIIVEDTHPAIIPKERWEQAQTLKSRNQKGVRKQTQTDNHNIFLGMLRCECCSGNMVYRVRKNKKSPDVAMYRCSTWIQKGNDACSSNTIKYDILHRFVLEDVQRFATLAVNDEGTLIDEILKANSELTAHSLKQLERTIRESKNRIAQIDKIFGSAYEDKVNGVITETMFKRMTGGLETEQTGLMHRMEALETEYNQSRLTANDLTDWVNKVKSCLQIESLTRGIIVELIDYIEASEVVEDGEKGYSIKVHYKFGKKK